MFKNDSRDCSIGSAAYLYDSNLVFDRELNVWVLCRHGV
jgi:hypothetical protein